MLVVSNTSPISNLAYIGRLELLRRQFFDDRLLIPMAVNVELRRHPSPEARASIEQAKHDGWLHVVAAKDTGLTSLLLKQVHAGEAEAISLAAAQGADLVLIDEQEGRRLAQTVGLRVTGSLGLLLRAKQLGLIKVVRPELDALRKLAKFYLTADLERKFLLSASES